MDSTLFGNDLSLTLLLSAASLLAVCVPFLRGLKVGLQALGATRRIDEQTLESRLRQGEEGRAQPVAVQMLAVLRKALQENQGGHPTEFLVDASRQYVMNDYEAHYARPISMAANILPPIGFIGTTGGLLILFLSMHIASDSLELGALALALTSSIFALIGFALLEGLKIRLYSRMLQRLDEALAFYRGSVRRKADASRAAVAPT
jgi:hypothetical protein